MKHCCNLLTLILLAGVLTACAAANPTQAQPAATSAPTPTAIPTQTPTHTLTPAPTSTATPPPTPTATLSLPVRLGTALPELEPVTSANVANLELVGSYRPVYEDGWRVVLSADQKTYFLAAEDGIDVFDVTTNTKIRHLPIAVEVSVFSPVSYALQPSADGSRLLVVGEQEASVYDQEGKQIFRYTPPGKTADVYQCTLSPSGKLFAVQQYEYNPTTQESSSNFSIYSIDTNEIIYAWDQGLGGDARGMRPLFSPDESLLVTFEGGQLFVWDATTWKSITSFTTEPDYYSAKFATFSPDGQTLAYYGSGSTSVWRIADRKLLRTWPERDTVSHVFSPDGSKIGVFLDDGIFEVRDIALGEILQTLDVKKSPTSWILTANIGSLIAQNDGSITAITPPEDPDKVAPPWDYLFNVDKLVFAPTTDNAELWMFNSRQTCLWQPGGEAACVDAGSIVGTDGQLYRVAIEDKKVVIYSKLEGGEPVVSVPLGAATTDVETIDPLHKFVFYEVVATANSGSGRMGDYSSGTLQETTNWGAWLTNAAASPDGKLVALNFWKNPARRLVIFDAEQRQVLYDQTFPAGTSGLAFSPDGQNLAAVLTFPNEQRASGVTIIPMADRNHPVKIAIERENEEVYPTHLQFTPSGELLVGLSNGELLWVDPASQTVVGQLMTFEGTQRGDYAFALSPDGKLLAAYDNEGWLKVWSVQP